MYSTFRIFQKCLTSQKIKHVCVMRTYKFRVTQIPLTNLELSMSDAEFCWQTAEVSQIDKRCPNPTIIKNPKLIKLSCHPFAS
jgi:hypothetical protein